MDLSAGLVSTLLVLLPTLILIARHNKKSAEIREVDEPGMQLYAALSGLPG